MIWKMMNGLARFPVLASLLLNTAPVLAVTLPHGERQHCQTMSNGDCLRPSYTHELSARQLDALKQWILMDRAANQFWRLSQERMKIMPKTPQQIREAHEAAVLRGEFGKWQQFRLAVDRHLWGLAAKTALSDRVVIVLIFAALFRH